VRAALLAIKEIGLHRPFAFDVERPAGFKTKRIAECVAGRGGNVDPAGQTISLHALGGIHGVTPDVEGDFVGAEHASDHWPPGVDPYAQLQSSIESPAGGFGDFQHRQGHLGYCYCALRPPFEYPASHHVTVADSLDRFEAAAKGEVVELREQETEQLDGFLGR
jgi:hypothetical protein